MHLFFARPCMQHVVKKKSWTFRAIKEEKGGNVEQTHKKVVKKSQSNLPERKMRLNLFLQWQIVFYSANHENDS